MHVFSFFPPFFFLKWGVGKVWGGPHFLSFMHIGNIALGA